MDLLSSYHSDSDGAPEEQEYSGEVHSETLRSEEYSHNVDYFNLDYSSSDDDLENSKDYMKNVRNASLILNDKPYGPQMCVSSTLNSQENFEQNVTVKFHFSNSLNLSPRETDVISESDCKDACDNINVPSTDAENSDGNLHTDIIQLSSCYEETTAPSKKQKTGYDRSRACISSCGVDDDNFHSSWTRCSEQENSAFSFEKQSSFSIHRKNKAYSTKSMPQGLPKKQITTFSGHSAAVGALRWNISMYSHLLLSASLDSSLKVWDIMNLRMVQDIRIPSSRIKSAQWVSCGTKLICGGFDKLVHVIDVSAGKELTTLNFPSYVYTVEMHPTSQNLFVAGVKDAVLAFDMRNDLCEPIRKYESRCGQVLDVKFLKEDGSEFICSTEIVSGDSSDRTIMAWDFASGAQLSNQIFHERYTCPFLQVDPSYQSFVAQTNGNYIAKFSAQRPYKMDKNIRYESHKVSGYPVGLDFTPDGKFLASGDAEGGLYIYRSHGSNLVTRRDVKPGVPTTQVKWHPHLHTTVATSTWDGDIQLWQ